MAVHQQRTEARVECRLRVPRGAGGDLSSGVRDVLAAIESVEAVAVRDVSNMRPAPADIYLDARADVTLPADEADRDPEAVRARLRDGFGVERVDAVALER
jgi:hypothetical protein